MLRHRSLLLAAAALGVAGCELVPEPELPDPSELFDFFDGLDGFGFDPTDALAVFGAEIAVYDQFGPVPASVRVGDSVLQTDANGRLQLTELAMTASTSLAVVADGSMPQQVSVDLSTAAAGVIGVFLRKPDAAASF